MRKIGVLTADKMGGLSQSFCLQRMREARLDSTIVMSRYFSNSARSDFKVSGADSLLRILDRFRDDDVLLFSRLSKAYLPMARDAEMRHLDDGEARRFGLHLHPVSEPMTRKAAQAALDGASMSFTVGGFKAAMGAAEPLDVPESEDGFEDAVPPRPSVGILLSGRLSSQTVGRCVDEFRQSGMDDVIVFDPNGRTPGCARTMQELAARIEVGRRSEDSNDENETQKGFDDRVVLCVTEAERVSDACASITVRRGRFQLFGRDGESKTVPAFRFNPSEIQAYGSFAAYAGDLLKAIDIRYGGLMQYPEPVEQDTPVENGRVIIGMASYPPREAGMLAAVRALAPQCHRLYLALNGYSGTALESVMAKLSRYANVVPEAYVGDMDLGSQNKFRHIGECVGNDCFLTADDDIIYPSDYVKNLVAALDRQQGNAIVSYHGSVLEKNHDGTIRKSVRQYRMECPMDTRVHMAGTGCGACRPARLGLSFDLFDKPKNTGDDELLAIWARDHEVPMVVAAHRESWLRVNTPVEQRNALWRNSGSYARRLEMLRESGPWPELTQGKRFFRVIIPVYGSKTLERALRSICSQTIRDYTVVVCDDHSTEHDRVKNEETVRNMLGDHGVFIENTGPRYAGAARNAAMATDVESEYTLFLDADDVFVSPGIFSRIKSFLENRGFPDVAVLPFYHHSGKATTSDAAAMTSPAALAMWQYPAPWTKCVRSALCQKFQEGVRRSNDVIQHFRTADNVKTVVPFNEPVVRYMSDGETTMYGYAAGRNCRSADSVGSILLVAGAILTEEWNHDYMRRAIARCVKANMTRGYPDAMRKLGGDLEQYVKIKRTAQMG